MTVLRIDKCSAKCSLDHKNTRELDELKDQHIQVCQIKVTGTHLIHAITVTRFMQSMPILALCRAQYCRCWTLTYSDPPFLHKQTCYGDVAPPTEILKFFHYEQNCTISIKMQLLEDMNVEYKSYKRTCLHCTSASGQIMQEKRSALDT